MAAGQETSPRLILAKKTGFILWLLKELETYVQLNHYKRGKISTIIRVRKQKQNGLHN
jgi:hypothetical protein